MEAIDYKEKLRLAKEALESGSYDKETIEYIFPELAESEDERIRKEIIELVMQPTWKTEKEFNRRNELCEWIEKQGKTSPILSNSPNIGKIEQKSAWSEDDEENLSWFEKFFRAESVLAEGKDIPQDRYLWFKNLKDRVQPQPKQEWNYNDEIIIGTIIQEIEKIPSEKFIDNAKYRCLDWLRYRTKSLRPQSHWKPSDEQIEALSHMIDAVEDEWVCEEPIGRELLKQLKKLKG